MSLFRSKKPARSFRPGLEALEARDTPAVIASVFVGDQWVITCDGSGDMVRITDSGKSGANTIHVDVFNNGVNVASLDNQVGVADVIVSTNGGNDDVLYLLTGQMDAGGTRRCVVNLGQGEDTFFGYVGTGTSWKLQNPMAAPSHTNRFIPNGNAIPTALGMGARLELVASSGSNDAQNDRFWALISSSIADGSSIRVAFTGGNGDDEFRVGAVNGGQVGQNARVDVDLEGGSGNDLFDVDYKASFGSNSLLSISVDGQMGDDLLDVRVHQLGGSSDLNLFGGQGHDRFDHTANVFVRDFVTGDDVYDRLWT